MKYPAPPPNPVADALQTAGDALQASNPGATHAILGSNQLLQGKFVRIDVPNFNGAPNDEALRQKYAAAGMLNASPMASYLRLGAVPNELRKQIEAYIATADAAVAAGNPVPPPSGFAKSTGEDLALGVLAFADDSRRRCHDPSQSDTRGNLPSHAAHYRTPGDRLARSSLLHTLGGWREHTDGNRITTTRGDKVEVIGGNYLLSVRSRDTTQNMENGWDLSGGHVSGSSNSRANRKPGHTTTTAGHRGSAERVGTSIDSEEGDEDPSAEDLYWSTRSGGTWRSHEGSTKGDSISYQVGDSHETTYGHHHKSTTGQEAPTPWHEPEDCPSPHNCKTNPKIIDTTFAELIQEHTGSRSLRVPLVADETHVTNMVSTTHAATMTSHQVHDTVTSHTTVETMTDTTVCDGAHITTQNATTITDSTDAANTDSTTLVTNTLDLTIGPSVSASMSASDSMMLGATSSVTIGATAEMTMGASCSITIGASTELALGLLNENFLGLDVTMTPVARVGVAANTQSQALAQATMALVSMYGI